MNQRLSSSCCSLLRCAAVTPHHPSRLQLMPVLLDAAGSSHADLRQCAVYGVGVGASLAPELFKPHAAAALAAVTSIIAAPVSGRRGEDVFACVDVQAGLRATLSRELGILLSRGLRFVP